MSRVFCPAWGAAGTAVTNATSATQIRLHVGFGHKVIRTLASAVYGALIINPGVGI